MAAFYGDWSDYASVASALCGMGAFLALFGGKDSPYAQTLVGMVAVISTVTATLKPARKTKVHTDLQRRFTDLLSAIAGREPTDANLRWAKAQRLKIEKDEPPVMRLVDHQARNDEFRVRGGKEIDMIPLSWIQRIFGYIWTFDEGRQERWKAGREG